MKYLIVGPSWVGDMVMAQTLFIAIKQQHPEAIIDVLAPAWSLPIIERMPEVRRGIDMPLGHGKVGIGVRKQLGKSLQVEQYTHAITLPGSFKSALIPFWAKIPTRIGWRGEMRYGLLNDLRVLDKPKYPLMVERYVALAYPKNAALPSPLPKPSFSVDPQKVEQACHRYHLNTDAPVLVMCPGAEFGPSKQWPAKHYAEVAKVMIERGWQVWLFGSGKDHENNQNIKESLPKAAQQTCFNLAGETSLEDAVDLMSVAGAVVSNDSGLMHIAAALNRPLVAVYGSTSADHTPPMNDQREMLSLNLECSPCFERECPLGHTNCMNQLGADKVIAALDRLTMGECSVKVLIVKTSSLGDVIHTLPALTDAVKAIPGIRFDWVVEEGFAEIPSWHPAVDKVIPVAIRRWRKSLLETWRSGEWSEFKKTLTAEKYDAVIDAQGLVKSALLTRKARGPKFGLDKNSAREPLASRFYDHPQTVEWNQHAVERIRQLFARSLNYPIVKTAGRFYLDKSRFDTSLVESDNYVVFVHGTTWATKHWPENYWCELAGKVNEAGYQVVLPWGNEKEKIRAEKIAKSAANAKVLPKLNLAGVAGVISGAKAAVAVDTGLGHLTAALETPAVSFYGPTSPVKVGAYGGNQVHLTLEQCPEGDYPETDPELFAPMTPEFVWKSLASILP